MRINFFGDFVSYPPLFSNDLLLSGDLKELIQCANVNVVNFEAPVKSEGSIAISKSGASLHQGAESAVWLQQNGFTVATLANNHMMDYGEEGLAATRKALSSLASLGAGTWEEAYRPLVVEVEGHKVAFLSLTHCEFGTLTDNWDSRYRVGTAWINHPEVDRFISKTRKEVDYLFIVAHAGLENVEQPLPEWRSRYRSFIRLGCDGVIASHPHISQGWEMFEGKPIVYSLGNFYFPKPVKKPWHWYRSLCASVICLGNDIRLEVIPIVFSDKYIDLDKDPEVAVYLDRLNRTLSDERLYMDEIQSICTRKMEDTYYHLFEAGGLTRCRKPFIGWIKFIVKKVLRRKKPDVAHLINNLWCESHRYCICRALKIKGNIR